MITTTKTASWEPALRIPPPPLELLSADQRVEEEVRADQKSTINPKRSAPFICSDPVDQVDHPEQEDEGEHRDDDRHDVGHRRAAAAEDARDQLRCEHQSGSPNLSA